jgi:hypothetical protein
MVGAVLRFGWRVIRDRVVLVLDGQPPRVVGRIVRCPCCGEAAAFEET